MSKKYNLYLGKAGQFVVMSHFLMRGWNVAIPEVDVGDDLFDLHAIKKEFFIACRSKQRITCSGQDFTHFRTNFSDFPIIQH